MTNHPVAPPEPQPPDSRDYWGARPPWYAVLAGGGIFLTLIVVLALLLAEDGNRVETAPPTLTTVSATTASTADTTTTGETSTSDPQTTTSSTTSSTGSATSSTSSAGSSSSSTTVPSSTTGSTITTPDPGPYAPAMWPWFDSTVRYDDPAEAAEGFAVDYLGFDEPLVGPFQEGDGRSGEVEVRPTADGPVTVVFVRLLGSDDTWWVLGAATELIVIEAPSALDEIDSPLEVSGQALAFEGVVGVELRADGVEQPLVTGSVTGGGTEMRPFDASFDWNNPGEGAGAVVLVTRSMDDGRVWSVSAVRVSFAAA